jgi:hypothetical protein
MEIGDGGASPSPANPGPGTGDRGVSALNRGADRPVTAVHDLGATEARVHTTNGRKLGPAGFAPRGTQVPAVSLAAGRGGPSARAPVACRWPGFKLPVYGTSREPPLTSG